MKTSIGNPDSQKYQENIGKCIWHMGTSDPFTFKFWKISKFYTFYFLKNYGCQIYKKDIYRRSVHKNVPLKNILYFRKYKER
jgi:hypothetical protein